MTLSTAARNAANDAALALLNIGSAGAPTLELGNDASFTQVLISFDLDNDAFADSSDGAAAGTLSTVDATGLITGTATHQRFKSRDGAVVDVRNAATDAIVALLNGGNIEFTNSDGSTIYLTQPFDATAFGFAVNGVATANSFPKTATASAGGTATHQRYKDSSNNLVDSQALGAPQTIINGQSTATNSITYASLAFSAELPVTISITQNATYRLSNLLYTQPAT
ncbi:MAG: hypothetical protein AAF959_11320 [Cyanobacteria bacterium P01_D01_bin.56]